MIDGILGINWKLQDNLWQKGEGRYERWGKDCCDRIFGKDNIYAQKSLGDIYYFGKEGTEKNENKAQEWYLKAAEHG